jgi:hypothetical protein
MVYIFHYTDETPCPKSDVSVIVSEEPVLREVMENIRLSQA